MKYILDRLDKKTFENLKVLVEKSLNNPNNPKLGRTDEYLADSTFFRPKNNVELTNLINGVTGYSSQSINSFFHVRYNVGDKLPRHRDRSNHDIHENPKHSISYSFLLNMCDEGGEFLLDDQEIKFDIPGQYISFDGQDLFHEIKEIKSGVRDVLVIWYRPKSESTLF